MAKEVFSVRLETDDHDRLEALAKNRGQTVASLSRQFIVDGIAGYDQAHEATMQLMEQMQKKIDLMAALLGGSFHTILEQKVLAMTQNSDETPDAYKERLRATYTNTVFEAISKGNGISAAVEERLKKAK